MDFADDFVVDDPLTFFIFLKGNLLQISSGLEVILGFFPPPSLVCLNYLCYFFFTDFGVPESSRDNFTEFGVLELFWNRHNTIFL